MSIGLFGSKTKVPQLSQLTLPSFETGLTQLLSQKKYIPELAELGEAVNTAANKSWQESIFQFAPQTEKTLQNLSNVALDLSQGKLPSDVASAVARSSAATAMATGQPATTAFGRGLTLRDLGLTSLQGVSQGTQLLNNVLNMSSFLNPSRYDPFSNLFTSRELLNRSDEQARLNWEVANRNAVINAANKEDPFLAKLFPTLTGAAGAAIGGIFGGGAGAAMGGQMGYQTGSAIYGPSQDTGMSSLFNSGTAIYNMLDSSPLTFSSQFGSSSSGGLPSEGYDFGGTDITTPTYGNLSLFNY